MPLYIYEAAYTAESLAAMIKNPQDRIELAAKPLIEAAGGKMLAAGYSFGEYDIVVVYEAPDDTAAASLAMVSGAGGGGRSARTTKLLTGQEWIASLQKAQSISSRYQRPG